MRTLSSASREPGRTLPKSQFGPTAAVTPSCCASDLFRALHHTSPDHGTPSIRRAVMVPPTQGNRPALQQTTGPTKRTPRDDDRRHHACNIYAQQQPSRFRLRAPDRQGGQGSQRRRSHLVWDMGTFSGLARIGNGLCAREQGSWTMASMFLFNAAGCVVILSIAAWKRSRHRSRQNREGGVATFRGMSPEPGTRRCSHLVMVAAAHWSW